MQPNLTRPNPRSGERPSRLQSLENFGSNPGNLSARYYVPPSAEDRPALVVVLHGCTQTADAYDHGAGWTRAADDHGFALLFPEQNRANNPNLCFNWFSPGDARRGRGEAHSMIEMVETIGRIHAIDPSRVFVTGLSAGGAMAAVLLAAYPDIFAGGAIIAGLPFATANNVPQALERMRGHEIPGPARLGQLARSASRHEGPWPSLSVWHGTRDMTVDRKNASAIVDQWRQLHEAPEAPCRSDRVNGHAHRIWCDRNGREVIEEYEIEDGAHGTPLSTGSLGSAEVAGPHMLEAGISSTRRILRFWGLTDDKVEDDTAHARNRKADTAAASDGIGATIENALRAAGLLG